MPLTEAERAAAQAAARVEARDPATSMMRLVALCRSCLDDVLANPALSLIVLEHPDFWFRPDFSVRLELAQSPRCPPEIVAAEVARPDPGSSAMTLRLVMNRALGIETRRAVFLSNELWYGWASVSEEATEILSEADRELLGRAGFDWTEMVPAPPGADLSDGDFERLAHMDTLGFRLLTAHPHCPRGYLDQALDNSRWWWLKATVAAHPNLAPATLARCLDSTDPVIRQAARTNPSMTAEQRQQATAPSE